jgi:hypothetical protein
VKNRECEAPKVRGDILLSHTPPRGYGYTITQNTPF